ncbi:spindle pole body protein Sfi1 [Borealophlyctis nickersoniae]|nr:spindle pole body protein Sfi1 [Borealophlyctis nickersoniae]
MNDVARAEESRKLMLKQRLVGTWKRNLKARLKEISSLKKATVADHRRVLRNALACWRAYVEVRAVKVDRKEQAVIHRHRQLARTCLRCWHLKHLHALVKQDLEKMAEWFNRRSLLRWVLAEWKERTGGARENRRLEELAEEERIKLLKRRALARLNALAEITRQAEQRYIEQTFRRYWYSWMRRYFERVDKREMKEVEIGVRHWERRVLRAAIEEWRRIAKNRLATSHDTRRVLRASMARLSSHAASQRSKRRDKTVATSLYTDALVVHFWGRWKKEVEARREERLNMEKAAHGKAAALHERLIVRRALVALRSNGQNEVTLRQKMALAAVHRNRTLALTTLHAWWTYTIESSQKMMQWRTAVRHRYMSLVTKMWRTWQRQIVRLHRQRMQERVAGARYERVVAKRHLNAWHVFVRERSNMQAQVGGLSHRHDGARIAGAFRVWKEKAKNSKANRLVLDEQRAERERRVVAEVLKAWRGYARERRMEKQEEFERIQAMQAILAQQKLRSSMAAWVRHHRLQVHKRTLRARADTFYVRGTLVKAIRVWLRLFKHRKWEKRFTASATNFYNTSLLSRFFHTWHATRPDWRAIYDRSVTLPVVYWGMRVSRRALDAWKVYTRDRKELRRRIKDAEGWKRERMGRNACVAFLKAAEHTRALRAETVLKMQAQMTVEAMRKVQKYAMKWRAKTLAARAVSRGTEGPRDALL